MILRTSYVLICYIVPNNIFEITIFDDKFEIVFELTSLEIFEIKVVLKLQFSKLLFLKSPTHPYHKYLC